MFRRHAGHTTTHNRFIKDIDLATGEFINYLKTHSFTYALLGFSAIL